MKRFEDLIFTDDFMFCKTMQNPRLCKKLIEMILFDVIGKNRPVYTFKNLCIEDKITGRYTKGYNK